MVLLKDLELNIRKAVDKGISVISPEDVCVSQCAVIRDPYLGLIQTILRIVFIAYIAYTFLLKEDPFMLEVTPTTFRSFWASSGLLSSKKAEIEQNILPDYCRSHKYHWSSTSTLHHDFICLTGASSEMHHLGESSIFFSTHMDQKTTKQTSCVGTNMTAFCSEQGLLHP